MSKCKINGKVLAVRLGRDETQIALVRGTELLHTAVVSTPAGAVEDGNIRNAEAVREMLKEALSEPEFKRTRQVVFSLCTSQVVTEVATTPDLPASRLEKLIEANMDMYFPMDMKEYQIVWQVIGPKPQKEEGLKELAVQLWAVPSAMLARYYQVANACGLSVAAIDYCGHSLATAVGASFAGKAKKQKSIFSMELGFGKKQAEGASQPAQGAVATEENPAVETQMHLYLETDLIGMTFVQEGQVVLQRFIRCGSQPAYHFSEIAMMLDYFQGMDVGRGSHVTGVLSGSLASNAAMVAELDEMLGIPLSWPGTGIDPIWMICTGAVATNLDFGTPALNRPGTVRRQVQSQIWQYALVLVGGLAIVAVVFMTLSARLIWNADLNRLETQRQTLNVQMQTVAGYADNYKKYSNLYNNYSSDWETIFSSLRTNNDNLVLALEELENLLPEGTSVVNLQISPEGLQVSFACTDKEEAAYLIMALREMKYAKLNFISDLSGGGGGAAESYGPQGEEAPPVEGSNNGDAAAANGEQEVQTPVDEQAALKALIRSELSEEEIMNAYNSMSDAQIALLEENYAAHPQYWEEGMEEYRGPKIHYKTLADLFTAKEGVLSDGHRAGAIRQLLTANPVTMNRFVDMVEEDFWRDEEAILFWHILPDLQAAGVFTDGKIENIHDLMEYSNILADACTKDVETIAATEQLLCTDEVMERWYIYYLEAELAKWEAQQAGQPAPEVDRYAFLDLQKIFDDVIDGGFDTGDEELDALLDGLLSQEAWDMITALGTENGVTDLMNKYMTTGTTGNIYVDAVLKQYLETGTTGSAALDRLIENYVGNQGGGEDVMDQEKLNKLLTDYLATGTTGNALYDALLNQYLATGSTGNSVMDEMINKYLEENFTEQKITDLLSNYVNTGTTGNPVYDALINSYLDNGTTGNEALDGWINNFIGSSFTEQKVIQLMTNYFETGSTGNAFFDGLINSYLQNGTTGNEKVDAWIENYLKEKLEGDSEIKELTKEKMTELLMKYLNDGTTGNILLDAMIEKYASTGTTGNPTLDKLIAEYMDEFFTEEMVASIVEKYLTDGTTGSKFLDGLILNYLTNGTTGNKALDKLIDAYIDKMLSSFTMEELVQMINKFKSTGTTGNPMYDALLKKYIATGTTGIPKLDEWLKLYESLFGPLRGGSSGGNGGLGGNGGSTAPADTRVIFTVSLEYTDALKNAELERHGLDYDKKIEKLEVGE